MVTSCRIGSFALVTLITALAAGLFAPPLAGGSTRDRDRTVRRVRSLGQRLDTQEGAIHVFESADPDATLASQPRRELAPNPAAGGQSRTSRAPGVLPATTACGAGALPVLKNYAPHDVLVSRCAPMVVGRAPPTA